MIRRFISVLVGLLVLSVSLNLFLLHEYLWAVNATKKAMADHEKTIDEQNEFLERMRAEQKEQRKNLDAIMKGSTWTPKK